jgi:anaerobic C4-dicarboxylate transporter
MRKLKTIIAILAISLATTFSTTATEKDPLNITQKLRTEIISMLGNEISLEVKTSSSAEFSFIINNENEIVIISVDSKIEDLKAIIKDKLNYKKILVKGAKKGEIYIMPLRINTK